eukprot:scaffold3598_cov115-Cylindrotheca_fusiformis.AAC.9
MESVPEGNTDPKMDRIRWLLKWLVLASVATLIVIVVVAIPMALKSSTPTSTSSSKHVVARHDRPNHGLGPLLPSTPPSESPTGTAPPPSFSPTITAQPTTDRPSLRPSSTPTTSLPTQHPTNHPTIEATTMPPTYTPIDPNHDFKMRLFWQKGYYWQESWDETWFCVECTKCDSYGRKNGRDYGCEKRGNGESENCGEGDMFWVHRCSDRGSEFNIIDNGDLGMQVRLAGTNLCMGRGAISKETDHFNEHLMQAMKCDKHDKFQQWAPIKSLSRFELRAFEDVDRSEEDAMCVSQLHHPKNEEVLSMFECKLCRIYETRYWEEYKE